MLPSLSETVRALYGVLRLARFDLEAIKWIDPSPGAAKRSFIVLVPLTFIWLVQIWILRQAIPETQLLPALLAYPLTILNKIITVLFFYLVIDNLLRKIGGRENLPLYISAQNWASLPVSAVMLLMIALWYVVGVNPETIQVTNVIIQAAVILYSWVLTVASLKLSHLVAFALCVLEILADRLVGIVTRVVLELTAVLPAAPTP